jgi:hypothetical protein
MIECTGELFCIIPELFLGTFPRPHVSIVFCIYSSVIDASHGKHGTARSYCKSRSAMSQLVGILIPRQ